MVGRIVRVGGDARDDVGLTQESRPTCWSHNSAVKQHGYVAFGADSQRRP